MSARRMFSRAVTDSDEFIELSAPAQALYLHLCLSADDDGFTNQINISILKAKATPNDLDALIKNGFIIRFNSGVAVITHWHVNNSLRKDRYNPTSFEEELAELYMVNSVYHLNILT